MTQYSDKVEEVRLKNEAQEWGKSIKYMHLNNSVIETLYQNGDKHFKECWKGGKQWTVYSNESQKTLVNKFVKWITDRSHYGK